MCSLKLSSKLSIFLKSSGWPTMPTGAIPTSKNNNPNKKSENNADDNNPYFYADSNNPDDLCKLGSFLTRPVLDRFHDSSKVNALQSVPGIMTFIDCCR